MPKRLAKVDLSGETLDSKSRAVATKLGLSEDEVKIFQDATYSVYQECGGDMEPEFKRRGTCSRAVVLEVSLDAGRWEQNLLGRGPMLPRINREDAKSIIQKIRKGSYEEMIDLAGPAFRFAEYEVGNQ